MGDQDKEKTQSETTNEAENPAPEQQQPASDVHPICQNAPDQEKCEEFADRLGEANENIDKHED